MSASRRESLVTGPVEAVDGGLQRLALDEAHGVAGPTLLVVGQPVDGHDAGVFQPAGDLGFQQEAAPAVHPRFSCHAVVAGFGSPFFSASCIAAMNVSISSSVV